MKKFRNSQKRYYIQNTVYFITIVTTDRYPYFKEDIYCEIFLNDLVYCKHLKKFKLYGYKINPDHVHLMIQPGAKYNYSQITGSIKRNVSRDINIIIDNKKLFRNSCGRRGFESPPSTTFESQPSGKSGKPHPHLEHILKLQKLKRTYQQKYHGEKTFPKFKWQPSFHDHIIRNEKDFNNHIRYLEKQWIKHSLKENKWLWINENFDI